MKKIYWQILSLMAISLIGCSGYTPPVVLPSGPIIHAVSFIKVVHEGRWNNTGKDQSITVTNNMASQMSLAPFSQPPPIDPTGQTAIVDIGDIQIIDLYDNDLRHCPPGATGKCTKAGIRLSMVGVAGLANASNPQDIIPVFVIKDQIATQLPVGASIIVQTISIGVLKNVVRLADFVPVPSYQIQINLKDAGAGVFTGTIKIEYFIE